ncbi:hypothetical protein EDD79_10802 [Serpentinicella alkaliphila]|uniref:Uncharacterized protein n=1 Tax=Serpentinicella alkaliphila TaxID=1734049 RepID=A0A4R2T847_9FIRM|nr:hypothetical protein EDD79_10802 [Serpentinicella alkaliphila]
MYAVAPNLKEKFPTKVTSGLLEDNIEYCQNLIQTIKGEPGLTDIPTIKEKLNYLEETVKDDIEQLELSKDEDAKIGHKTADSSFF